MCFKLVTNVFKIFFKGYPKIQDAIDSGAFEILMYFIKKKVVRKYSKGYFIFHRSDKAWTTKCYFPEGQLDSHSAQAEL